MDTAPVRTHPLAAAAAAEQALRETPPRDADAVAWLSEHVAALQHVVYPAFGRLLGSREALGDQRALTHSLEHVLRQLHGRLNGDSASAGLQLHVLRVRLLSVLAEHTLGEERLLERLRTGRPPEAWQRLLDAYDASLALGPTRPHPHGHLSVGPAYRVLRAADRLMDTLDSRSIKKVPAGGPSGPSVG